MYRRLIATRHDVGAFAGRITLAAILFPHGLQHALGYLGGYGFRGTLGWMTETLGFPTILAALAIVTELIAPVALVLGLALTVLLALVALVASEVLARRINARIRG